MPALPAPVLMLGVVGGSCHHVTATTACSHPFTADVGKHNSTDEEASKVKMYLASPTLAHPSRSMQQCRRGTISLHSSCCPAGRRGRIFAIHQPQRFLQNQQVSLEHLGPVLNVANLIELLRAAVSQLLPLCALLGQRGRLLGQLLLLLCYCFRVPVQVCRSYAQLVVL